MRDFILNSEELIDQKAYDFINEQMEAGLLSCAWIHFNNKIKLAFFPDERRPLSEALSEFTLEEVCAVAKELLETVKQLELAEEIFLENVVWDVDSIYLDEKQHVSLICLPAVQPDRGAESQIYVKRIYALLEEMLSDKEGAEEVIRQIEYQKEQQFGDWESLSDALDRRSLEEDEAIVLKSINTAENFLFKVGHELPLRIGTDPEQVDFVITGVDSVSPLHAVVGWNDISFYVMDYDSANGTFVNNQQITPNTEVPIGTGTVLRFADCTFSVE